MADNVAITAGAGTTVAADEVVDGTLGTVKVQYVKLMDGTLDGTTKAAVSANGLAVQQGTAANLNATIVGTGTFVTQSTLAAETTKVIGVTRTADGSGNLITSTSNAMNVNVNNANANGQAAMASSAPVVIASNQSGIPVGVTATANGATASRVNAAATTNATSLKASAGQLYTIDVFNTAAYNVFLKLYNKASAPTVGTDVPVMTIPVQAGGGYSKTWPMGLPFATGIAYAITKLQADSDTTVVVAGDLTGNTTWI